MLRPSLPGRSPLLVCSGRSELVLSVAEGDRFFSLSSMRPLRLLFSSSALNPFLFFPHIAIFPHFPPRLLKRPQLLRFLLLDQPISPPRYSLHRQRPQPDALQLFQRVPLFEQNTPQLFFFGIPHPHFVPIIRRAPPCGVGLTHRFHFRANLFFQPLQVRERQHSLYFDLIDLLQVRPILQHLRRQLAVVRQKHQPRRCILQISHREHPFSESAQTISQRLPAL